MEIARNTTMEAWKAALNEIREHGESAVDTEGRSSTELLNLSITIRSPQDDVTKPIEVMRGFKSWSYPEQDELEDVFFKKEASSSYYYTYGARIFNYTNSKDQIEEYIIPLLSKQPNSRRAIVVLYQPVVDSKLGVKENPCLISIFFRIIDSRLSVSALLRSNDIFIGWPANIYQLCLLQKYVAERLGIESGSMTTISHSAHIFHEYDEEIEAVLRKA
ncbi:MAG: thymidylate synthase [archaeon]